MTAKKHRANETQEEQRRGNGQDPNGPGRGGRTEPQPGGAENAESPEQARSQANAKAAAEEAARLAEEAAREAGEPDTGGGESAPAQGSEDQLQAEIDDLKGRLQRAMAETENVRRRADRERQEAMKYAASPLAKDLLGVADNLRRALESVPADKAEQDETVQTLLSGVQMTEKELMDAFVKHGIQQVSPKPGERFDPHRHEAMYEVPTDEQKPGTVVHVVQDGYVLNERLLRPARVGVAKAAGGGQPAGGPGGNVDTQA